MVNRKQWVPIGVPNRGTYLGTQENQLYEDY